MHYDKRFAQKNIIIFIEFWGYKQQFLHGKFDENPSNPSSLRRQHAFLKDGNSFNLSSLRRQHAFLEDENPFNPLSLRRQHAFLEDENPFNPSSLRRQHAFLREKEAKRSVLENFLGLKKRMLPS